MRAALAKPLAELAAACRKPIRKPLVDPAGLELLLHAGRPLRLTGFHGHIVRCLSGCVWITAPGKHDDIFLQTGQCWIIPTDGLVLIEAERCASVAVDC